MRLRCPMDLEPSLALSLGLSLELVLPAKVYWSHFTKLLCRANDLAEKKEDGYLSSFDWSKAIHTRCSKKSNHSQTKNDYSARVFKDQGHLAFEWQLLWQPQNYNENELNLKVEIFRGQPLWILGWMGSLYVSWHFDVCLFKNTLNVDVNTGFLVCNLLYSTYTLHPW